jgi:hypothetical protein
MFGGDQLYRIRYNAHRGKHYPSKTNHEKMSLCDLITFSIMAHKHFNGIYKKASES